MTKAIYLNNGLQRTSHQTLRWSLIICSVLNVTSSSVWAQFTGVTHVRPSTGAIAGEFNARKRQERQSIINSLREELQRAQFLANQLHSQRNDIDFRVGTAKLNLQQKREQADDDEALYLKAKQAKRDMEQEIIASQNTNSAYAHAEKTLRDLQQQQRELVSQLLSLPKLVTTAGTTSEKSLSLTPEQTRRLKDFPEYGRQCEKISLAKQQLDQARRDAINNDPRWAAAQSSLLSAEKKMKQSAINAKIASRSFSEIQQEQMTQQHSFRMAQQTALQAAAQLRQLGERP